MDKKYTVKGKTTKQLVSLDIETFDKLSKPELRSVVARLSSTANKRLSGLKKRNQYTPAVMSAEKSGGKFTTAGKNLNQLREEYIRVRNFLNSKTSTISGWKQTQQSTISALKKQGINVSINDFDKLWKAYEELKEMSPEVAVRGLKYNVLAEINTSIINSSESAEDIAFKIQRELTSIYERQAELEYDDTISGFFEL